MSYAKVSGNVVLKYPYGLQDLKEENPFTRFDGRYTIDQWFSMTETAALENSKIVEITYGDPPATDENTETVYLEDTPQLVDGKWVLLWKIVNKDETE